MHPGPRTARAAVLMSFGALILTACGGGDKKQSAGGATQKIVIQATSDARADAVTYLKQLCPKPIGGELNFMVWEGYTDTLFAKPFEDACGVKVNATYMGSSDDLVAKLRAAGRRDHRPGLPVIGRDHPDHSGGPRQADRSQAHPELRRPDGQLPGPEHGQEGHSGLRRAVGVRTQPAHLRYHEDHRGPAVVERSLGQEVPGQALASG